MEYPSPFTEIFLAIVCFYVVVRRFTPKKEDYLNVSYLISTLHAGAVGWYGWNMLRNGWYDKDCIIVPLFNATPVGFGIDTLRQHGVALNSGVDWAVVHVMLAYLLADTICVALWYSPRAIVAHHVVSSIGLIICLYFNIGYGMALRMARTETATVALNICWWLKKKADKHRPVSDYDNLPTQSLDVLYKFCCLILIGLYFETRVWSIPEVVRNCYPQIMSELPPYLNLFAIASVAYMQAMNVYWWCMLVKKAVYS